MKHVIKVMDSRIFEFQLAYLVFTYALSEPQRHHICDNGFEAKTKSYISLVDWSCIYIYIYIYRTRENWHRTRKLDPAYFLVLDWNL